MASALDVAAYILARRSGMTAMKLQKLVYFSQARWLVWDERPLFDDPIEAWANGPVCRSLYDQHRRQFRVSDVQGADPERLDADARETIDAVLSYYGSRTAQWLSDLSHLEAPWQKARGDLPDGAPSTTEIGIATMAEYYGSLPPET